MLLVFIKTMILMNTHNICFYEEIMKIIPNLLSSNMLIICFNDFGDQVHDKNVLFLWMIYLTSTNP